MQTSDGRTPGDGEIEALLSEFFRHEMPSELREPLRALRKTEPESSRGGFGPLVVVASASVLLALVLILPRSSRDDATGGTHVSSGDASPNAEESDVSGEPVISRATLGGHESVERYETPDGPVEQRSRLQIRSVYVIDPDSGSRVEVSMPELDIEVFPIEEDDSEEGTSPESNQPRE